MKTLLYADYDTLRLHEREIPEIEPHEVLLRVFACGICGSELEGVRHRSPRRTPPLILGHEFCGVIEKLGANVTGFHEGEQVVCNALVTCMNCPRCQRGDTHLCPNRQVFGMNRLGAFGEYVNAPASALFRWPSHVPAEAACLTEPLANGVHVAELIRSRRPKKVLVIGAGPIGLMCQQAAQVMLGAKTAVADRIPERVEVAQRLGAEQVYVTDAEAGVREWTDGEGADIVIDAVGLAPTKQLSIACTRLGGAAVWIGLGESPVTIESFALTLGERAVLGSYATQAKDMQAALDMIAANEVDVTSWTTHFPLSEGAEAFYRMLTPKGADIKAILFP